MMSAAQTSAVQTGAVQTGAVQTGAGASAAALTDAELAAHLAEVAGRILIEVRASGLLSLKQLGKAGDATANQFLIHALREQRPEDGLLSEESKDTEERLGK